MNVEDGKGRGYEMSVSSDNRGNVSAKSNPRAFYVSRDEGLAFNLVSIDAAATAGDYISYIKNTSTTKNLFVKQIHVSSENAAMWKMWVVSGTAAGTEIFATNMNLTSGRSADVSSYGNGAITGLTAVSLLDSVRNTTTSHEHSIYEDVVILGPNNAIAVEYDTGTGGAAEVMLQFHFEDIGREN